jgi:hypothetical protein
MHFIPNRTTDFLNDLPGVTGGMIEGVKKAVLDGLAPVLGVITLVYAIQLMVLAVRRRSQLREEEGIDDGRLPGPGRREEAILDPDDRSWSSYRPEQQQSDTGEQTRVFAQQAGGGRGTDSGQQH